MDRPKLLIVEDAEDLLDVWTSLLGMGEKYTIRAVAQGTTAVEIVESGYRPDVLITDYFLGDLTGLELVEKVRRLVPGVEVIVATGNHDNRALTEQAGRGDIRLLIKPVRFDDLTASIEERLQRRSELTATHERPRLAQGGKHS